MYVCVHVFIYPRMYECMCVYMYSPSCIYGKGSSARSVPSLYLFLIYDFISSYITIIIAHTIIVSCFLSLFILHICKEISSVLACCTKKKI